MNKIDFRLYNKLLEAHYSDDEMTDDGFVIIENKLI